ncbi:MULTISPECIES: 4-hydroxy-3-methylbut-2-enyl diphosphate reductase [unclassified Fusibacter]|uniref:4-hydroxy-3-methylbut-2-enyl diphosphate reductase n=1 Tax=unclassified Fusibacter TaxID=2624464 RepID=UPI001012A454|nr:MULTISPECIES: 4-hydroxy-3-methylbut-2-enyl diphosphate reductase [unclassified Fusibacter]MCK8058824.1 4-hydroxy-3-methylbut-2-enyl diphosphate reductase [Fusibacter sp. A2]NPE21898.1 4-hydroxy-3-methylbut-2-enyl diphosphate reductase [Fusibacter sp. A1]RXV61469.1 4-hydroxy-3-methylbut-2-enyl diphosphate reductase [Fusibacter sp. A1]
MQIHIAKYGGFCFGVRKAVNTAIEITESEDYTHPIYTYGPLIHNRQVVERLEANGATVIDSIDGITSGTVIVRSHGVPEAFYSEAEKHGLDVVDATCVFVKKVHSIVKEYHEKKYQIVILGDREHPEIIGINGWCEQDAYIINTEEDLQSYDLKSKPLCVVAQTTFDTQKWVKLTSIIKAESEDCILFNTICSATKQRQDEVRELSLKMDCIIVVGGKNSSNTQKLYEIARESNVFTKHIEESSEINVNFFRKYDKIGIVAGASTPDWIINEVIHKLKCEGEVVFNGKQ